MSIDSVPISCLCDEAKMIKRLFEVKKAVKTKSVMFHRFHYRSLLLQNVFLALKAFS